MIRVSRSTVAYNHEETTLLTHTTAMSCPSFSLPAGYSCPGASKHPESPCAHCYACQGDVSAGHNGKGRSGFGIVGLAIVCGLQLGERNGYRRWRRRSARPVVITSGGTTLAICFPRHTCGWLLKSAD